MAKAGIWAGVKQETAPLVRVDVGRRTQAAVSRMSRFGSVSRGTCARAMGTKACARNGCQAPQQHRHDNHDCSDANMTAVITALGLRTHLVIGCHSDQVGYYDTVDPDLIVPRRGGFREIVPDFAAFFARQDEGVALITHMADCGFVAVEMPGAYGFIHLTRTNMSCAPLLAALEHYDASLDDVRVRLVAAVSTANFPQHFMDADGSRPEDRFPGWHAAGLLRNRTRPLWLPSDPIDPTDVWEADNREMIFQQLMSTGLRPSHIDMRDIIDPGDLSLGHASHSAAMRGLIPAGRDAYVVWPRP